MAGLRKTMVYLLIAMLLAPVAGAVAVDDRGAIQPPPPATTAGPAEVVVSLPDTEAAGVVVTPEGRMFLTLPRVGVNHGDAALVEMVDGRPVPFPDLMTTVDPQRLMRGRPPGVASRPYRDWIVSPLGLTRVGQTLWVLDEGKRAGIEGIPEGAAKLVAIDIPSRKVIRTIVFHHPFLRDSMQLNDLRVDPDHGRQGTVYISNNGFAKPDASLIVVDIATGRMREVFHNAPQVSPAPGFMSYVEGQPCAYSLEHPCMPQGGVNGIELSNDHRTLYWSIPTNAEYYSIPTSALSDFGRSESSLRAAIRAEGQTVSNGGLAIDPAGNLYFGDASRYGILARNPQGRFSLVAHDARLIWPDGLTVQGGYLYVSIGQWQRMPSLHDGHDLRHGPYQVLRFKLAGTP
ncbi:L-dopachrome tautomerase-related protein [Frateuria aurantia]